MMKKIVLIFVMLLFMSTISAQKENINSGKYHPAKEHFETEYQFQDYFKFSKSQIQIDGNKVVLDKLKSITYPKDIDKKLRLIFENGLLDPMQIIGFPHLIISGIDELSLSNPNPQTKRFSIIVFKNNIPTTGNYFIDRMNSSLNPDIYFFEIQNKKADKNTSFEDFIKDANLTYLGYGGILI